MKKTKVKRFFIAVLLLFFVLAAAAFLFLKIFGKGILETVLSDMLGTKIKFNSFSMNLVENTFYFGGLSLPAGPNFGNRPVFSAAKFTVILDREALENDRKIVIERIVIENGILYIERNKKGAFNIAYNAADERRPKGGMAYTDTPKPGGLYKFASNVRRLSIKNSAVEFKDYYIYEVPFTVSCVNFDLDFDAGKKVTHPSEWIPVRCRAGFAIPGNRYAREGGVFLDASIAIYKFMMDVEITAETDHVDITQFFPYLEKYTPFSVNEGLFSSTTNFRMHNNVINSLTTMIFHRLNLIVEPDKQNAEFLQTTANRLLPYLTADTGEIIFDFVMEGPADDPKIDLGPQVRRALGLLTSGTVSRVLQQLQGLP